MSKILLFKDYLSCNFNRFFDLWLNYSATFTNVKLESISNSNKIIFLLIKNMLSLMFLFEFLKMILFCELCFTSFNFILILRILFCLYYLIKNKDKIFNKRNYQLYNNIFFNENLFTIRITKDIIKREDILFMITNLLSNISFYELVLNICILFLMYILLFNQKVKRTAIIQVITCLSLFSLLIYSKIFFIFFMIFLLLFQNLNKQLNYKKMVLKESVLKIKQQNQLISSLKSIISRESKAYFTYFNNKFSFLSLNTNMFNNYSGSKDESAIIYLLKRIKLGKSLSSGFIESEYLNINSTSLYDEIKNHKFKAENQYDELSLGVGSCYLDSKISQISSLSFINNNYSIKQKIYFDVKIKVLKDNTEDKAVTNDTLYKQKSLLKNLKLTHNLTSSSFFVSDSLESPFVVIELNDITEIIESQRNLIESKYKNLIFSKLSHEIKTPSIGINQIITELQKELMRNNFSQNEALSTMKNYLIVNLVKIMILSENTTNSITEMSDYIKGLYAIEDIKENIDVEELVTWIHCFLTSLFEIKQKRNLTFEVNCPEEIYGLRLNIDFKRLKICLCEALKNSFNFTEYGVIKVDFIQTKTKEKHVKIISPIFEDNKKLEIVISDTGIGIPYEKLVKINNDFADIEDSFKSITKDTKEESSTSNIINSKKSLFKVNNFASEGKLSLGLKMLKIYSFLMKIDIRITSEVNKGTILYFVCSCNNTSNINKSKSSINITNQLLNIKDLINLKTKKDFSLHKPEKLRDTEKSRFSEMCNTNRNIDFSNYFYQTKRTDSKIDQYELDEVDEEEDFNRLNLRSKYTFFDIDKKIIKKDFKPVIQDINSNIICKHQYLTDPMTHRKNLLYELKFFNSLNLNNQSEESDNHSGGNNEVKYSSLNLSKTIGKNYFSESIKSHDNHFILIVDDESLIRNSLYKMISDCLVKLNLTHKIIKACDGIDTLALCINYGLSIKMVISDENMEYINGSKSFQLLNSLMSNNKLSHFPTFIYTALEEPSAIENIKNISRCCEVIKKPVNKNKLEALLKRYLGQGKE